MPIMSSMLGWVAKGALLMAGVAGAVPPIAAYVRPHDSKAGGASFVVAPALWAQVTGQVGQTVQQWTAPAPPAVSRDPLSYTVDEWKRLQQSDTLGFASYASFILAHPGWPGENGRRAVAESQADASAEPGLAGRFFDRFPPLTAAGNLRYAELLASQGRTDRAADEARKAWRRGSLRPADETRLTSIFFSALRPEDHDTRMDMLLWQGSMTAAARELAYVSPERRAVFDARLAYRTNAPDAMTRGAAAESAGLNDAGFLADRANWMRNSGASATVRSQLARPHRLTYFPGSPEKWYEVLLTNARAALADGQYSLAYDISRQVDDAYPPATDISTKSLGERDDYTSLTWLAGTIALQNLNRPRDAAGMFERYSRGSKTPATQSKGLYWAGRATEAAGDRSAANAYYARAAEYPALYYGQLAAERLGQPIRTLRPVPAADAALRTAFNNREVVRAARLLGTLGRYDDQSAFVRQIAASATTESDHALTAELSRSIMRPDLGVMVGRSALEKGLGDYSAAGFPTVRIPDNSRDYWTIAHAIARQETQFNKLAVSRAGARGMMQLMPGTAREQAGKLGVPYNFGALSTDTDYNIQLGSAYFARMYAIYGSYPLAVAAYNAGGGNVNKWLAANGDPRTGSVDVVDWVEKIPFFETKNYVQRVLENAVVYDLMNPEHSRSRGPNNLSWYLAKRTPG